MNSQELYGFVIRAANIVAHRADRHDDHPTDHTVAAIKREAVEAQGMLKMALDFNDQRWGENALAAVQHMDERLAALVERQAA
jgi:hypothetical protein